jgi:GTP cyclohydrolase I
METRKISINQDCPRRVSCHDDVDVAHIGRLPGERIVGLSRFARLVALHARRPQTQERLTHRIADHTCMSLRGARAVGARTTTSALFGQLRDDPRSRAEFLALTKGTR